MHGRKITTNKVRVEVLKMHKANPEITRDLLCDAMGLPCRTVSKWIAFYNNDGQAIYKRGMSVLEWVVENAKAVMEIESVEEGYRLEEIETYLQEEGGIFSDPIHPEGVACKTTIPGGRIFFFGSTTIDEQNRIIATCISLSDQNESRPAQEAFDV